VDTDALDADALGVDPELLPALAALFDPVYYGAQAGPFADAEAALAHYLAAGGSEGLDPHPLFDTGSYLALHPDADAAAAPLVHFLESTGAVDPGPFFDSAYYLAQEPHLAPTGASALLHYVQNARLGKAASPNPLFDASYYVTASDGAEGGTADPFAHYLAVGCPQGRLASRLHADMVGGLARLRRSRLARGQTHREAVVFFFEGGPGSELALLAQELLPDERRAEALVVLARRDASLSRVLPGNVLIVEDFADRGPVLRPSALRLLARSLAAPSASIVVTDMLDAVDGTLDVSRATYAVVLDGDAPAGAVVDALADGATRVVFGSRAAVGRAFPERAGYPANIALRPYDPGAPSEDRDSGAAFLRALMDFASRDAPTAVAPTPTRPAHSVRGRWKIIAPCSDWAVSGVNTSFEAAALELIRRGWDVEVLFTRDRASVEQSAGGRMPAIPYRFLERSRPGVEELWGALVEDVERRAPAILFTAYDFVGNSVIPALSEDVGAVMWVQADDGDYYEQAYRLGRYCNAVVCVSKRLREGVVELHPGIGRRTRVIHNSSVAERDTLEPRAPRGDLLRLIYTGRIVQYQKRALDFVPLADALLARDVPFRIDLVGTFPPHDEAAGRFPHEAAEHLERGTIRLLGRLPREQIFEELRAADLFVLLSEFEGFPLSLVEAMAAGCVPVVAEMASGIDEVVVPSENGLVLSGRDYAVWADAIVALHADRERLEQLSAAARAAVRAQCTVERVGEELDALLLEVAQEVRSGYARPPALTWGSSRSLFGDVLPPPSMARAVQLPGLG
jgi:glycosyltransferase involved in cell wall biosynthesis